MEGALDAVFSIDEKLEALDTMQALVVTDVLDACDPVLGCPPDDQIPVAEALLVVKVSAEGITAGIDAFLSSPPDDQIPQAFFDAISQVSGTAQGLADNAQLYHDMLTEPTGCTPDPTIDKFACMEIINCTWIDPDPTAGVDAYCCCNPTP